MDVEAFANLAPQSSRIWFLHNEVWYLHNGKYYRFNWLRSTFFFAYFKLIYLLYSWAVIVWICGRASKRITPKIFYRILNKTSLSLACFLPQTCLIFLHIMDSSSRVGRYFKYEHFSQVKISTIFHSVHVQHICQS